MAFPKKLSELCTPAYIYFVISVILIILTIFQNINNKEHYTFGTFHCKVPSTLLVYIVKIIYLLFWTWILNLICKDGHKGIAWLLVLFPFIIILSMIVLIQINK
uniref:Uncharacterized protein n=1 Tax=viral metagenome TaxID=1070528 RepID=A0A6C0H608_9ZZZZ